MTEETNDHHRGLTNRGTDHRGVGPVAFGPSHQAGGRAAAPTRAPRQRLPVAGRTIYVVTDKVFLGLPEQTRKTAIAELISAFDFVGKAKNQRPMRVVPVDEAKFPEAVAFSDAVVRTVAQEVELQAWMNEASRIQDANVARFLREHGERYTGISTRTSAKPDRGGIAINGKRVHVGRRQRYALPHMASAVALDSAIADVLDEVGSKVHLEKVRERRSYISSYWGTAKALADAEPLMAIDNPTEPAKWSERQRRLLGVSLGRMMAHEVRHLYLLSHASTGLGSDSPLVLSDRYARFSKSDQAAIISAIQKLERQQSGAILVEIFPGREGEFPF